VNYLKIFIAIIFFAITLKSLGQDATKIDSLKFALKDKEIDFIAERHGEKMYLQVALQLKEEKTIEREFGNLLAIKDNYPKKVITIVL
jgi:predicted AAA+ superfamily ATPase